MLKHSLFSDYYLAHRKERAQPASSQNRVEGSLAVAPDQTSNKPLIVSRMNSRTWWENGWNNRG